MVTTRQRSPPLEPMLSRFGPEFARHRDHQRRVSARSHRGACAARPALRGRTARSRRSKATAAGSTDRGCWPSARRGRAMLLAALGDLEGADEAARPAMAAHDRLPMPFERARTLLLLGQLQRRQRKKESASASLQEAFDIFERAGRPAVGRRGRASELVRANVGPGQTGELTPSEQRVAELAASGMKNRDVATALFISPKTVEANLARIYRKLGIKSRAELGRHMRKPDAHEESQWNGNRETPYSSTRVLRISVQCARVEPRVHRRTGARRPATPPPWPSRAPSLWSRQRPASPPCVPGSPRWGWCRCSTCPRPIASAVPIGCWRSVALRPRGGFWSGATAAARPRCSGPPEFWSSDVGDREVRHRRRRRRVRQRRDLRRQGCRECRWRAGRYRGCRSCCPAPAGRVVG